ncbi:galactosyltransferase-related protein [Arthrobacter sp. 260]|uniref:glycosyltransferase family 2 protein n=1 Tax=Arthrobacter sp. 260 TaxID=2735314 RepID=UPI0014921BCA|nr:galactosyltransferase-related protein [Arthrobacter sp. 260]NOJ59301.1 glycosyltransferase family 2 protein [Arthrobacter sp. 260]
MTTPSQDFSVLVISSHRDQHLTNLVYGLNRSTLKPTELVIVYMDQPNPATIESSIPVRVVHISPTGSSTLPLAAARNAAAQAASTDTLIFLDVDCIPASTLCETLLRDLHSVGGLVMAQPRYLGPAGFPPAEGDDGLMRASIPHHARTSLAPPGGEPPAATDRYELFWSLGFAVTAADFELIGGFDESFTGYGGEDTDFSFTARNKGVRLSFSSATMFHQHHGVSRPPLQHFADIVANSQVFNEKWGRWPMTGWLAAFTDRGYLRWMDEAPTIEVIRHPTPGEVAAARVDAPY